MAHCEFYANGQLASIKITMDKDEVLSWEGGQELVEALEEAHEQFIYRFDADLAIDPKGNQALYSITPIFPDD